MVFGWGGGDWLGGGSLVNGSYGTNCFQALKVKALTLNTLGGYVKSMVKVTLIEIEV